MRVNAKACLVAALPLVVACGNTVKSEGDAGDDPTPDVTEVEDGTGDTTTPCTEDSDCDDGDLCNGAETCGGEGVCEPGTAVECPDPESLCRPLECVPSTGECEPGIAEEGTECEADSDLCTEDVCDDAGTCTHPEDDCDDEDICTDDSCDPSSGCVHDAITGCCNDDGDCDDGDPCTDDSCRSIGVCSHVAADCDDDDACTVDGCDSSTGCTHETLDCDDDNDCTTDSCDTTTGCGHTPATGSCDDGDPCTDGDVCDETGHCLSGTTLPTWYRDSDGDGFGDASVTTCAATAPTGYVSDHTDCCDSEASVRPDQTTYFCASFTCAGSTTPSWDYNCGGADYRRWTDDNGRCSTYSGYCTTYTGWVGTTVPACGVTATYLTGCGSGCTPITVDRCQECI